MQAVGHTPLVRLNRLGSGLGASLLAKVESFNPGGSVKDRIALAMLEDAEQKGFKPGATIIEPTSGNTGIGLAMAAAIRGYKAVFVMPDKMSVEKERLLKAYGAQVIRTASDVAPDDARSHVSVAKKLVQDTPNSFSPNQYFNPSNPQAHYETTGPEIWEATQGKITHLIAGMGTGGTISGIARYLKEKNPVVKVIGVDAVGSLFYGRFYGQTEIVQPYRVEGIGDDFMPGTLDFGQVDEVVQVGDKEAFLMARRLAREEGILAGGSSGAALYAALKVSAGLGPESVIVVLLPDSGRNYLSTIFNDEWMKKSGYLQDEFEI